MLLGVSVRPRGDGGRETVVCGGCERWPSGRRCWALSTLTWPSLSENLGDLALKQRQHTEALSCLGRAVAIYNAHEGVQEHELRTRFSLAQALVRTGERTRALIEARKAADGFRKAGMAMY